MAFNYYISHIIIISQGIHVLNISNVTSGCSFLESCMIICITVWIFAENQKIKLKS